MKHSHVIKRFHGAKIECDVDMEKLPSKDVDEILWKHKIELRHENFIVEAAGYIYSFRHFHRSLSIKDGSLFTANVLIVKVIFQLNSIVYLLIYGWTDMILSRAWRETTKFYNLISVTHSIHSGDCFRDYFRL